MSVITGSKLGKQLCEALGIDYQQVMDMTIHCNATDLATVNLTMYVPAKAAESMSVVLKQYAVFERPEPQPVPPPDPARPRWFGRNASPA